MNFSQPDQKHIQRAYGSEALQFGELRLPGSSGPHPTVIIIHGGFWRARYGLSLMEGLAEDLTARGIATWNIEYRRIGDPGGGWPGTMQDVARAADYLRVLAPLYNLDLQRVFSLGHSAGGHLAIWLAARRHIAHSSPLASAAAVSQDGQRPGGNGPLQLAGAMSLAGVVDLELAWRLKLGNGAVGELLGGDPGTFADRYAAASPAMLLPLGIPQMLIHGTADDNVPLIVSQAYTRTAIEAGDEAILIELARIDHFALIDPLSAAWNMSVAILQGLIAGS